MAGALLHSASSQKKEHASLHSKTVSNILHQYRGILIYI